MDAREEITARFSRNWGCVRGACGRLAAGLVTCPAALLAQNIGGAVLLALPALLLSPGLAALIKWGLIRRRGLAGRVKRRLLLLAALEFLLWEVVYPLSTGVAHQTFHLGIVQYLSMAAPVFLIFGYLLNRALLPGRLIGDPLANRSGNRIMWLTFPFLTPGFFLALVLLPYGAAWAGTLLSVARDLL